MCTYRRDYHLQRKALDKTNPCNWIMNINLKTWASFPPSVEITSMDTQTHNNRRLEGLLRWPRKKQLHKHKISTLFITAPLIFPLVASISSHTKSTLVLSIFYQLIYKMDSPQSSSWKIFNRSLLSSQKLLQQLINNMYIYGFAEYKPGFSVWLNLLHCCTEVFL